MRAPSDIQVWQKSGLVDVNYADGQHFTLSALYLRTHSPAADGHLAPTNSSITITQIEMVGNYAIKFIFSDGYQAGIYNWDYFYQLAKDFSAS